MNNISANFGENREYSVLVFGGTSAMAIETLRALAPRLKEVCLTGITDQKITEVENDLLARGVPRVTKIIADLAVIEMHDALWKRIQELIDPNLVLLAYGVLPDQKEVQLNREKAVASLVCNFTSAVSLLTIVGNHFESKKSGTIAVISSVAGDRGRFSNYVYGTAKAGLTAFLQGYRARLSRVGVTVITVKPGLVDSPMTAHLQKTALFASASEVGKGIAAAIEKKREIVYLPWFWKPIMLAVRAIPECIFKKLSF